MEGLYVGSVEDISKLPNGYGKWMGHLHKWDVTLEGEWESGDISGKAILHFDDGDEVLW